MGFPLGRNGQQGQSFEARTAIANGANEIDMVMNVGAMKAKNLKMVREDMFAVRRACRTGIVLKVILETCMLADEEKVLACQIAKECEARLRENLDGLQQGRGDSGRRRAHAEDRRSEDGGQGGGGMRSLEDALAMIQAGATRLGTSSGVLLVSGGKSTGAY